MSTPPEDVEEADFETAITASGFGKFNILLLAVVIPGAWTLVFETTPMSYVFPAAQCDLHLTLENKGMLNAAAYIGMTCSDLVWGFFSDTLGRRKLLIAAYFLHGIVVLLSGLSQSYWMLVVAKFAGGSIINGPFATLTSYLSEFHSMKHRGQILMLRGLFVNSGNIVIPLIAMAVLPYEIDIELGEHFKLHSWNVFLFLCSLPSFVSSLGFLFLPESPKFLMAMDRSEDALKVFQTVFKINTGKPAQSFPIRSLDPNILKRNVNVSAQHVNRSNSQVLREGLHQILPLFRPPYRKKIIIVCIVHSGVLMSINTLRLWFPQMFIAIKNYDSLNKNSKVTLCEMIQIIETPSSDDAECSVHVTDHFVYINLLIISAVSVSCFILACIIINRIRKKILFCVLSSGAGMCATAIYFSKTVRCLLVITSLFMAQSAVSLNILYSIVVDLFPTTMRTMAFSIHMLFGRAASILGNLMFPVLLKLGCFPTFLLYGLLIIGGSMLSLFLPKIGEDANR